MASVVLYKTHCQLDAQDTVSTVKIWFGATNLIVKPHICTKLGLCLRQYVALWLCDMMDIYRLLFHALFISLCCKSLSLVIKRCYNIILFFYEKCNRQNKYT